MNLEIKIIHCTKLKFKKGEKIHAEIKMPGWMPNQAVAVSKNRCITIDNCDKTQGLVKIKIKENKNSMKKKKNGRQNNKVKYQ